MGGGGGGGEVPLSPPLYESLLIVCSINSPNKRVLDQSSIDRIKRVRELGEALRLDSCLGIIIVAAIGIFA